MRQFIAALSVAMLLTVGVGTLSAQEEIEQFGNQLDTFSEGMADVLPHYTTIGQQWSDAYIGQLLSVPPSFGVGVSVGTVFIPSDLLTDAADGFGDDIQAVGDLAETTGLGFPLPGYTVDARIGGFILPFDAGIKAGFMNTSFGDNDLEYMLLGGDVRYSVIEEGLARPNVSAGLGVNYTNTTITAREVAPGPSYEQTINGDTLSVGLTDPDLFLEWDSTVIDLTAQASKNLLIFRPFGGVGVSYGRSNVGAGLRSEITYNDGGTGISQDEFTDEFGDDFNLDDNEFAYRTAKSGWSTRVFGGLGLNFLMFNLDLGASYDFLSGSLGAQVGTRVQF